MGDLSSLMNFASDELQETQRTLLLEVNSPPKEEWPHPIAPWEYNPTAKKLKSKRQSIITDSAVGKTPRGQNVDGRKKQNATNSPREKNKLKFKGFRFHSDIGEYMREYREMRQALAVDYKNCTCHGAYTAKDVERAYEMLPRLKKRTIRRKTRPEPTKRESIASVVNNEEDKDTMKDELEDEVENAEDDPYYLPAASPIKNTQNYMLTHGPDDEDFPEIAENTIDNYVDRRLSRDFFGLDYQYCQQRKGTSCPVVKITLPERHDVRRVFPCVNGFESPLKGFITESSASVRTASEARFLPHGEEDVLLPKQASPKGDDLRKHYSPTLKSVISTNKSSTLSAKVRDFRPFSRNGLATRVSKAIREKRKKKALSEFGKADTKDNPIKQDIPWKVLRYLGYNPSMRKYLHEIYSPAERKLTKSPLVMHSKKYFNSNRVTEEVSKPTNCPQKENRKHRPLFPKTNSQKVGERRLLGNKLTHISREEKNILVETYLRACQEEQPKLAILPKLDTVVKPKVAIRKFIVS